MLKSFIGPFVATFFISMFVLIMQFLWRMIDDLVGKGLDFAVIAELLFYVAITLVPMALPLAVLLSSIMTFGSLGENYELIALKCTGISLYRIMKPLKFLIVFLMVMAFVSSNNILPVQYEKHNTLVHAIRIQKAQMSHAGMPLLGDAKYGSDLSKELSRKTGCKDIALCAYRLTFFHPVSGKKVTFEKHPEGEIFFPFFSSVI